MKSFFLLIFTLLSNLVYSQTDKDSLLNIDINILVEEMEFMYGYDQTMREYIQYKSFDKSETNRIENLADSLREVEINKRKLESVSLEITIREKYINSFDALHTERMIEIIKKYGFPSKERIKKHYKKDFIDPEFDPLILLIHSPKKYWEELKVLMLIEYKKGIINQCIYGYSLWHFNGRKSFQPMLENGWKFIEENGIKRIETTCGK